MKKKQMSLKERLYSYGGKSSSRAKVVAQLLCWTLPIRKDRSAAKLEEVIGQYVSSEKQGDRAYIKRLKRDILFSRIYYKTQYTEYFLFEFERLSDAGRREFIGWYEFEPFAHETRNESGIYRIFLNKYITYQRFREYYHREMIEIKSEADREIFFAFVKRHPTFMVKVESGLLGIGMSKVDLTDSEVDAERIYFELIERIKEKKEKRSIATDASGASEGLVKRDEPAFVLEECITQSSELANLHPSSVNTVRIATFLKDDHVIFMFALLSMGAGGSATDHTNVGGRCAEIDLETGIVTTGGWWQTDCSRVTKHPDTGAQIIGMKIPRWNEVLVLAEKLAHIVPEQKYVGWDFALTDEGWVLIEGNESGGIARIQAARRKGLRNMFNKTFYANQKGARE